MSSRKRNIVYCGGIDQTVNEEILQAAFIPFGDIKSIQIPKDFVQGMMFRLVVVYFTNCVYREEQRICVYRIRV